MRRLVAIVASLALFACEESGAGTTPDTLVGVDLGADLGADAAPFKTITQREIELPVSAITFDGAFAVSSTTYNAVYLWPDVDDAGDMTKATVLGQAQVGARDPSPACGFTMTG